MADIAISGNTPRLNVISLAIFIVAFTMGGMGANQSDVQSMALLPELLFRHAFGRSRSIRFGVTSPHALGSVIEGFTSSRSTVRIWRVVDGAQLQQQGHPDAGHDGAKVAAPRWWQ